MAASGGRRRAETVEKTPSPVRILGGLFGGAVLGALAWYFLVSAAIDFGGEARNGRGIAWVFMALATVGAVACLLLVLVLGARGLGLLGVARGKSQSAHAHTGGHRRTSHSHK